MCSQTLQSASGGALRVTRASSLEILGTAECTRFFDMGHTVRGTNIKGC